MSINKTYSIAVDAMGGDNSPDKVIIKSDLVSTRHPRTACTERPEHSQLKY